MTTIQETFKSAVIETLKINNGGKVLSYAEYLDLPAQQRSGDEADVVDSRFTQNMLTWLGYDSGDIIYNRLVPGNPQDKPDFVVKISGSTAFTVEDKSTTERFDEASVKQLRRYTAGTSGYCLWTNAKSILGLRFDANGQYQTLVDIRVDNAFGFQQTLFSQEANFEILHLLFGKQRFTSISNIVSEIAIPESEWAQKATPLTDEKSLKAFIGNSRTILDQLTTAIKARLSNVALELDEAIQTLNMSKLKYRSVITELLNKLKGGGAINLSEINKLEIELHTFEHNLVDLDISQIERLKPSMSAATLPIWANALQDIGTVIATLRESELLRAEPRRIRVAYLVWLERYKTIEGEESTSATESDLRRQQAFAEQVSYVFFARLLLTRVLEDKGIMPHLVSDGGFSAWHSFLKGYALDSVDEIGSESFLPLVYRRVASFYRHFFQQPIFDWFLPDDYLLAMVLHHLNAYNFKDVTSDLLGFTYEAFIDRVARNKKGHFLTPPSVVEYMLDRADYSGPNIIGESLIDTACGSGSFLVHAARRLRQAIASAMAANSPVERARTFIDQVQHKLVGLEINPFSCYLAELNLFIQVLDDLALLWARGERPEIDRFAIFNTNSLEMPRDVLHSTGGTTAYTLTDDAIRLDEAALVKAWRNGFSYVICNPPYVNRGIILGAKSYGDFPFYRDVVKGDENFYLLFLRLAAYYVSPGGTICFICPLNLFGDESTMRAREMFNREEWSLRSITRFYARNILFPGVLQGVCVIRFDNLAGHLSDIVDIRGGFSVEEAAQTTISVQRSRIIQNYPAKTNWSKPWLVHANSCTYDIWEYVRNQTSYDLTDLTEEKLKANKGDVRSTWAQPFIVPGNRPGAIPLTKGKNIVDWGGWSAATYLDHSNTIPRSFKDYRSSVWVQTRLQRIANLLQPETVIFLKEVSGLEMIRPIRGTLLQRDALHSIVADETILVMYTLDSSYDNLAYAIFGLMTSSIYNFLFSLFSSNAHANFKEILRLPVPPWSSAREKQLAEETRKVMGTYEALYTHQQLYGTNSERQVSPNTTLAATTLPTLSLEELKLRGVVSINSTSNYSLDVLLDRALLVINQEQSSDVIQAIERIIRANGKLTYNKGGKDILFPNPRVASAFLSQLRSIEQERVTRSHEVTLAQKELDDMVLDAYNITSPVWRETIEKGVPWAQN